MPRTTKAKIAVKDLNEGDIIRVPQYKNALEVTYVNEDNTFIGVEFSDDSKKTSTSKSMVVNQNSGFVYLLAGTTDKGEVKEIEVVGAVESEDDEGGEDDDTEPEAADVEEVVADGGVTEQVTLEYAPTESDTNSGETSNGGEEGQEYYGIGAGRRRKLDAIEAKGRLNPIGEPDTLEELIRAIREVSLDGVRTPPEKVIERVETIHGQLPEEAQSEYVSDAKMLRTLNAVRRYFSQTYLPRMKRESEMPGPMEAGPSKYPHKKLNKRQESYRNATEEIDEKIDRLYSRAGGAKQRALNAIGSSVAEQTEKREEDERETLRDLLEPGQILQYRNPTLQVGVVKRVNKKSVRVVRPNEFYPGTKPMSDEPEPKYTKATVDLDPQWLTQIDRESYPDEIETIREFYEEIPDDYDEAITFLTGGEV